MAQKFELGDRVRVNETCEYQELIGTELFVCKLEVYQDLSVQIITSEVWPPRPYGQDEWIPEELDKIT